MLSCPYCKTEMNATAKGRPQMLTICDACSNAVLIRRQGGSESAHALPGTGDVREVAPVGSIGHALLQHIPEAVEKLPVLPEISHRIGQMVRDPEVSMSDLAEVVKEDQVIAMAVLRLANSAVYGGLSQISELNAACARLGMKTVANTVQAVANRNLFITGDKRLRVFMQRLWRHAVATAYCAEQIAALLAVPQPETLFLGGLMHDVGKVILLDIVTGEYSGAIGELRQSAEVLREALDSFHTLAGLHVAKHYDMPPEFRMVIYCHEDPAVCPDEELTARVHIIALANAIAKVEGFTVYDAPADAFLTSHPSTRFLNLSDVRLATLRVDLEDRLNEVIHSVSVAA